MEKYISPCLTSIFDQRLSENEYEIILINDGTIDNSLHIIKELVKEHDNIQILEQSNKGLSVARNTGLKAAIGEYILFVDSDDLLIKGRLKKILDEALGTKADLIVADYIVMYEDKIPHDQINTIVPYKKTVKSGSQLFLEDLRPNEYFVWRTLYRREFLNENKLQFIEAITFEDVPFTQECYLKANRCIRMTYPFYLYRRRRGSLSTTINKKSALDLNIIIERIWGLKDDLQITKQERQQLLDNLFATFSLNMWYISKHEDVLRDRKEIVADLKNRVPKLRFSNGFKQRFVSFLYKFMPCQYLVFLSYLKKISHNEKSKNHSMLS